MSLFKKKFQCIDLYNFLLICVIFQPLYASMKTWRDYIFTSVCQSVCVSVFLFVKEQIFSQTGGCTGLNAVFVKWLVTELAQILLKLVTLGQRSRSQWRRLITIFLDNSLLTSLLYISALLCLIKLKFGMPLRYAICGFHKNQKGDDVMVTSF